MTSTVASLRRALAAQLERAFAAEGRDGTAALDARLLLAHALCVDASALALRDDEPVDARVEAAARGFIERRIAGEPVARILGTREFWGLDFTLGPDTLVPRPDTETVVEAALAFVDAGAAGSALGSSPVYGGGVAEGDGGGGSEHRASRGPLHHASRTTSPAPKSAVADFGTLEPNRGKPLLGGGGTGRSLRDRSLRILDIGTGSGAILIALLSELPNATGVGTDIAEGAIRVARANAERHGLAARAGFVRSDWATAVAGPFDLVLSNPPYIRSGDIATLPVEVGGHDPHLALDGGADGLAAYRGILADLGRLLATGGKAFLEIGLGQGPEVADLAAGQGFAATLHRDLAGIERVAEIGPIGDG